MENKYKGQTANKYILRFMDGLLADAGMTEDISILEVGCNEGANLRALRGAYPEFFYTGIDICDDAIRTARELDPKTTYLCADIEKITDVEIYWDYTASECHDFILLPDILEHLSDPAKVLRWSRSMLKPGGQIIALIPNLMHVSVMYDLLKYGLFTYTQVGLLDSDHKHLFTRESIFSLFRNAGFEVEYLLRSKIKISDTQKEFISSLCDLSNGFIIDEDFETFEYLVITEPKEEEE